MRAVSSYPDVEQIPSRNKARLRGLGTELCAQRLAECKKERH